MSRSGYGFLKKTSIAVVSQAMSLCTSFVLTLILPRVLSVEEYSYWQLLLLYTSYVLVTTLGIPDGAFVKYGGKDIADIDADSARSEFFSYLIIQVIASVGLLAASFLIKDKIRMLIIGLTGIFIISGNGNRYLQNFFAAIGKIEIYAKAVILEKLICLVMVLISMLLGVKGHLLYCVIYVGSSYITLVYTFRFFAKEIGFHKPKISLKLCIPLLSIGIYLMLANFVGTLTVGIARQTVERYWGISEFGKISLSISITNYILYFINQIGLVLYPMLCKDKDDDNSSYEILSSIVDYLLPVIFVFSMPMVYLLNWWIPAYSSAIRLLPITLIICYSNCKMSLMYNNYLKIYRQEKFILLSTVISLIICIILSFLSAKVLSSITLVVLSVAISMDVKSTLAEIKISQLRKRNVLFKILSQRIMIYCFAFSSLYFGHAIGLVVFVVLYILYLFSYRKPIKSTLTIINSMRG